VIALLSAKDPGYVCEAAKRGAFAYIVDGDAEELERAIDITLQRFAEHRSLQAPSASGRSSSKRRAS
jgi:AmiR/NasT family two-component response regulator